MSEQSGDSAVGRKPDFIAYSVRESRDGKGHWNKVGAAWQHRDGQGLDIQLESLPLDGRLTLRELREERMTAFENERQSENASIHQDRSQSHGRTR